MSRALTSCKQFEQMVSFMEEHGDLNKTCTGLRGKLAAARRWSLLTTILNSGSGSEKTEEKWKKVWSDFKNKIKKKTIKIRETAAGDGEGHAGQVVTLSALEQRVLTIMNPKWAQGLDIPKPRPKQLDPLLPPTDRPRLVLSPAGSLELHWDVPIDTNAAESPTPASEEDWQNSPSTSRDVPAPAWYAPPAPDSEPEHPAADSPPPPQPSVPHMPVLKQEDDCESTLPLRASPPTFRHRNRRTAPNHSLPGPFRRRLRQTASASSATCNREWREYLRRRDEDERRYREESERRREATERRWQDLFDRFLDVLVQFAPRPPRN